MRHITSRLIATSLLFNILSSFSMSRERVGTPYSESTKEIIITFDDKDEDIISCKEIERREPKITNLPISILLKITKSFP